MDYVLHEAGGARLIGEGDVKETHFGQEYAVDDFPPIKIPDEATTLYLLIDRGALPADLVDPMLLYGGVDISLDDGATWGGTHSAAGELNGKPTTICYPLEIAVAAGGYSDAPVPKGIDQNVVSRGTDLPPVTARMARVKVGSKKPSDLTIRLVCQ